MHTHPLVAIDMRSREVLLYNPAHNILELYNVLVQVRVTT